jgi:hypothetical protein
MNKTITAEIETDTDTKVKKLIVHITDRSDSQDSYHVEFATIAMIVEEVIKGLFRGRND